MPPETKSNVVRLVDRPTYGMGQIDKLLGLHGGTAKRWIDGYDRGGQHYPPVIRETSTGDLIATWGEFVEARLLSEYRDAGVPLIRMRPAIEVLREELNTPYPLASSKTWVKAEGKELVRRVEDSLDLAKPLRLVVRNNQLVEWTHPAESFRRSVRFAEGADADVELLHPDGLNPEVVIDPLRGFGEPVVRGVRTEIIGELFRSGESPHQIAEDYELEEDTVESAIRYELRRAPRAA